mgnify:CR=1 FL=1
MINKSLIALTLSSLFTSTALYADNNCDVDLETGLTINKSAIEFFEAENKEQLLYRIDNNNNLTVNDKNVALNTKQQALVTQYATDIRAMVPQVKSIAVEGVNIALEGVNLTFNKLLGEGNKVGADLTQELTSLREELSTRFSIEHGFTLGENGVNDEALLGKEFEQRINSLVENAVVNSMGSLLVAFGQEMMSSSGSSDSFEQKMESFGESIEHEMELRAEQITRKADSLCTNMIAIDELEEKLKLSIADLANINVITVKSTPNDDSYDKTAM